MQHHSDLNHFVLNAIREFQSQELTIEFIEKGNPPVRLPPAHTRRVATRIINLMGLKRAPSSQMTNLELIESIAAVRCEGAWTIEEAEGEAELRVRDNIAMDAPDELYDHWDVGAQPAPAQQTQPALAPYTGTGALSLLFYNTLPLASFFITSQVGPSQGLCSLTC